MGPSQARFRLAGRPQSARLQHRGPPTRRYFNGHFRTTTTL